MAFARVTYRRYAMLTRPLLFIFKTRTRFILLYLRGAFGILLAKISGAGIIRAGSNAIAAADTALIIYNYNARLRVYGLPLPGKQGCREDSRIAYRAGE